MRFLSCFFIFGVLATSGLAQQDVDETSSSSLMDFSSLWQRKMQSDIYLAEQKIKAIDTRGTDNIKLMTEQQMAVLEEIEHYEQSLVPMQALSHKRKHCVQKFKPQLVTVASAQASFQSCITAAQTRVNTLTSSAKATLAAAKITAFTTLPRALSNCNTTYINNSQKLEDCTLSNIDTYAASIQTSLRQVDKSLDASICSASDLSIDAIQCSIVTQRNAILTMGKVMYQIDHCIKDEGLVCSCPFVPHISMQGMQGLSNVTTRAGPNEIVSA